MNPPSIYILGGTSLFQYTLYGGPAISDLQEIIRLGLEVLKVDAREDYVTVHCVGGVLDAAYGSATIQLLDGTLVTQAELEAAAARYWTELSERSKTK
jgi:hypothetical protein